MKSVFQGMVEGIMIYMKREDALKVLHEAVPNCETPEQRTMILTAIQRVDEGVSDGRPEPLPVSSKGTLQRSLP